MRCLSVLLVPDRLEETENKVNKRGQRIVSKVTRQRLF